MSVAYPRAIEAAEYIKEHAGISQIDLALVLGSGWASGSDQLGEIIYSVNMNEIPGFSTAIVHGHGKQLHIIRTGNHKLALVFTGRTHYYEDRNLEAVAHATRTSAALGAKILLLTNGCGSLEPKWTPGTVVAIKDHLNLTGATPLKGASFIDMTQAYSKRLRNLVHEIIPEIPEGIYAQFSGPQYETPAEVRMAGILGANLVGMSTSLETIAAREIGLEVLALSLITNQAAGLGDSGLDHSEVIAVGKDSSANLASLLSKIVEKL